MIRKVMRETDKNAIGAWDLDDDMLIVGYSDVFYTTGAWYKLQLVPGSELKKERKYFWDNLTDSSFYLDSIKSFENCMYDTRMKYIFVLDDISEITEVMEITD